MIENQIIDQATKIAILFLKQHLDEPQKTLSNYMILKMCWKCRTTTLLFPIGYMQYWFICFSLTRWNNFSYFFEKRKKNNKIDFLSNEFMAIRAKIANWQYSNRANIECILDSGEDNRCQGHNNSNIVRNQCLWTDSAFSFSFAMDVLFRI